MREILRTKHYVVTLDEDAHLLRRTRTPEPFASLGALKAEYEALLGAMNHVDRSKYAQLVDTREAPPRNDPEFEGVVASHHVALYRDFLASAVLVQSAVGTLHVRRMLTSSSVEAPVFSDEEKALVYLAEALAAKR